MQPKGCMSTSVFIRYQELPWVTGAKPPNRNASPTTAHVQPRVTWDKLMLHMQQYTGYWPYAAEFKLHAVPEAFIGDFPWSEA